MSQEVLSDKHVIMIHSNEHLVSKRFEDKFCEDAKDQLEVRVRS